MRRFLININSGVASSGRPAQAVLQSQWLYAFLLLIVVAVVYLPALQAGYIWDDDAHLTQNPCITGALGFKAIWTSSRAFYYPLVLSTFWIVHKFVGLNPLPYHLLNIGMHGVGALLLWRVLRQLGVRGAWLGAALWAVHPIMVESVAWITELKNTQSGVFYLLSILLFLKADRALEARPDWRLLTLSAVSFAFAVTSKSSTVMLPVVLALCLWWKGRKLFAYRLILAPFFLISIAASAWTIWEQKFHAGAQGTEWSETVWQRLAIAGRDLWFYLAKLFWPTRLAFIYPRWEIDSRDLAVFVPIAIALIGLVFLWWKRNGPLRPVFFAVAYFVISLFPVLGLFNVYFFRYSFVADHFQYLASAGPIALVAAGLMDLSDRLAKTRFWFESAIGGLLLITLSVLSWREQAGYQNLEALWRTTISENPNCWLAHTNLGVLLKDQGKLDDAVAHYRAALAALPNFPEALTALGAYEASRGHVENGMDLFRAALSSSPKFAPAWYNLGNALGATGKTNDAIAAYRNAIDKDSSVYSEANNSLGVALSKAGKSEEAIPYFVNALKVKPNDAGVRNNFGFVLAELGYLNEAAENLKESIRLNPNAAQTYVNLGRVYDQLGKRDDAIANFRHALAIQPDHAEAKVRLREIGAAEIE